MALIQNVTILAAGVTHRDSDHRFSIVWIHQQENLGEKENKEKGKVALLPHV